MLLGKARQALPRPTPEQTKTLLVIYLMCCFVTVAWQFSVTYVLLYPFMLISTIFHEFGHASACMLTGGSVESIQINPNESGLTRFVGGAPCAILPAGYLGSTLIGSLLIFLGFSEKGSRWASLGVNLILAATIWWAELWITRLIAVMLIGGLVGVFFWRDGVYMRWLVLFMGCIAALDSIENIAQHTIFNYIEESDAVQFAEQCSRVLPFFVFGLIWLALAGASIGSGVLGGLVVFKVPHSNTDAYF